MGHVWNVELETIKIHLQKNSFHKSFLDFIIRLSFLLHYYDIKFTMVFLHWNFFLHSGFL